MKRLTVLTLFSVSQFGNQPAEQFSPKTKKPKISTNKCGSIILECRSVRVGTLRRMVTKPVVVSNAFILKFLCLLCSLQEPVTRNESGKMYFFFSLLSFPSTRSTWRLKV